MIVDALNAHDNVKKVAYGALLNITMDHIDAQKLFIHIFVFIENDVLSKPLQELSDVEKDINLGALRVLANLTECRIIYLTR